MGEGRELRAKCNPTEQSEHLDVRDEASEPTDLSADLVGEFARWAEDEALKGATLRVESRQESKGERGRLAAASARFGYDVTTL
jgi:hypothetical protein